MSKVIRYYQGSVTVKFLVVTASFLAAVSLLALSIGFSTDWPFGRAFDVTYRSISISWLLGTIGWMVFSRLRAGPVLLNIKVVYPGRGWFAAGALGYVVFLSLDFDFGHTWLFTGSQIVSLLLVVCLVVLIFGRLQIRKRGVWLYAALLPWHNIKSYTLRDGMFYFQPNRLGFWANDPKVWEKKGYKVPEEHIKAFETYLLEHNIPEQQNIA